MLRSLSNWIARHGFALLVLGTAIGAVWAGHRAALPEPVPDFALRSAAVYRIEVVLATFAGPYLVLMALVLALHNRGFTDIGVNGLRARDMRSASQQGALRRLGLQLGELNAILRDNRQLTQDLDDRVRQLEASQRGKLQS